MAIEKRGWYGDSKGHARAGRLGGLKRGKRSQSKNAKSTSQSAS